LRRFPPANLNEQLEDLKGIAEIGYLRNPSSVAMKDAYEDVTRAYLMTAVSLTSNDNSERSEQIEE
jgi:hypothetical protein